MNPNNVNEVNGSYCVCVAEACYVVYFGKRQSAENSIFPQPCFWGFSGGKALRKRSWQII